MSNLSHEKCEACQVDAPPVDKREQDQLLSSLDDWQIVDKKGVPQLLKVYTFKNFKEAMVFANAVGELAEEEGHHPAILLEWGRVTIRWWTHAINGLHRNDFIMAAKTDAIPV